MHPSHRLLKRVAVTSLGLAATLSLAPVLSAQTAAPPKEEAVITLEKFSVQDRITDPATAIGTDTTRNTVSITREALLAAPAGYSGLKMLESLPGFNVQTADALGLYEFGNSVFVRAFSYTQISFVLDGVPMGRSAQFGGSPIYRYVDNENIGRVTANTGSADVTAVGYNSLGPSASYFTVPPSKKPGATLSVTTGSHGQERSIVKVQSGEWHGLSAYLSRSKNESTQWRGNAGTIDREHWDGKLRYEFGAGDSLQFTFAATDYFDWDSPSITKAQYLGTAADPYGRIGRYFGYLKTVPDLPETVAGIKYSNTGYTDYYYYAINSRTDALYSLSNTLHLGDKLTLDSTAYYDDKQGHGASFAGYSAVNNIYNTQLAAGVTGLSAPRGVQYGISYIDGHRKGLTSKLVYNLGPQKIQAGFWIERDNYHRRRLRNNLEGGNPNGRVLFNEIVNKLLDFQSVNDTRQLFLQDSITLLDGKLTVDGGVKSLDVDYKISGHRGAGASGSDYNQNITPTITDNWKDNLLPQLGAIYRLTPQEQLFTSYSENLARPQADDVYSQATFAGTSKVAAEKAKNFEVGIRTNRGQFNASLALYSTSYKNRLQTFTAPVAGTPLFESFYQNVGKIKAHGAEISGGYRPAFVKGLALNASLTYNVSEFQQNYTTQASATAAPFTVAIKDKITPDSPKYMYQWGGTYEPVSWAAVTLSGRYVGERYSNFINTEWTAGYVKWDASLDLGGGKAGIGALKNVKVRLNVDNLFDRDALGTTAPATTGLGNFRPIPDRTFQLTVSASF
ncbi:MAG: TonB-dependent receptor [Undibacterium sp.]|nr:TonB-dependent receptor [Opitutaceae bacterium]